MTDERKIEIYTKAKELLIEDSEANIYFGLCAEIDEAKNSDEPDPYYHMDEYPEIWKQKPEDAEDGGFWFPTDAEHLPIRIKIFDNAIEELKS